MMEIRSPQKKERKEKRRRKKRKAGNDKTGTSQCASFEF